jgi:phosphoenolpyruvate carboxylase
MNQSDQHDQFLPRDKELRARVRLFGELLGNVIHRLEGQAVFDAVENLRRGFVSLRKQEDPDLRHRLMADITCFDESLTERVIRAFSIYFSLVNIAEEDLFYRWRRAQVSSGEPLWTGSFDQTLRELHDEGITAAELEQLLNELHYQPVFTAHPTEARRRTTMENQRRVFETAGRLNQPGLGEEEHRLITEELETQIQILWRTNEVRVKKPQVQDEIKYGLFYFEESLFEAVPQSYRFLEKAIRRIYGVNQDGSLPVRIPAFLHFGSWIGGDRDGNPHVTPEVTALSCRLAMEQVLREYIRRLTCASLRRNSWTAWRPTAPSPTPSSRVCRIASRASPTVASSTSCATVCRRHFRRSSGAYAARPRCCLPTVPMPNRGPFSGTSSGSATR